MKRKDFICQNCILLNAYPVGPAFCHAHPAPKTVDQPHKHWCGEGIWWDKDSGAFLLIGGWQADDEPSPCDCELCRTGECDGHEAKCNSDHDV